MKNDPLNNPFRDICSSFTSLVLVSTLFLISSLPVITIGLSLSATYQAVNDVFLRKEGSVIRCFLNAVKLCWKTALPLGSILTLFSIAMLFLSHVAMAFMNSPNWLLLVYNGLILLSSLCLIWSAALIAKFSLSPLQLILLAVAMVGKHLFTTLTAILCIILSCHIARLMPPLLFLLPGCCCFLLVRLLQPRVNALTGALDKTP